MPIRAPVTGKAKLYLTITVGRKKGQDVKKIYELTFLEPDREVADPAWRLMSTGGSSYEIALTVHGPHCTCPDFAWCRDGRQEKGCKHVAALRATGLLRNNQ